MTEVTIEIDGVLGTVSIDDGAAPSAFLAALPIEATLTHGYWSGRTCEFAADITAGSDVNADVIGLIPGSLALDRDHRRVLISYGASESRTSLGPHYVARLGCLTQGRAALLAVLGRMHDEGDKSIRIRRVSA